MKLYYSQFSPYARKVRVVVREAGLADQVSEILAQPLDNPPELPGVNPLNKVPCLQRDDGPDLMNSHLICEYLAETGHKKTGQGAHLYPSGEQRWVAKRLEALSDGMMDAIVNTRIDTALRSAGPDERWMARWRLAIERTLGALEAEADTFADDWHIGTIALAVVLDYLDLRYNHYDWRAGHPNLILFHKQLQTRQTFMDTHPEKQP